MGVNMYNVQSDWKAKVLRKLLDGADCDQVWEGLSGRAIKILSVHQTAEKKLMNKIFWKIIKLKMKLFSKYWKLEMLQGFPKNEFLVLEIFK